MSAFQKLIQQEEAKFHKIIDSVSSDFNKFCTDDLFNYIKCAETGDASYLDKQYEKIKAKDLEKSSTIPSSVLSETSVRKNDNLEMPAPSKVPGRQKKIKAEPVETSVRSTRTRTKPVPPENSEKSKGKLSDVIIQNTIITRSKTRQLKKEQEAEHYKEEAEHYKEEADSEPVTAQQQRELLEKEKEKLLELHRLKDEKHKQALTEKEDKLQKSKEEADKKRLLAKNKAKLLKEKDERQLQAAQKMQDNVLPIYMTTRAPLLPTADCYDSDDEQHDKGRPIKPDWCKDNVAIKQVYVQLIAGEKIKNTMFCGTNHNVDLVDMFENIDPRKLKRTSSAQWRQPPRYTLFSMTSDIQFSEDSEDEIDVKQTTRKRQ